MLRWIDIPPLSATDSRAAGRPLAQIAKQPAFLTAVLGATIGYGVMNLLVAATPLAMVASHHSFSDAAFVIQWHFVAMFAPSLITGMLIRRLGLLPIIFTGAVLTAACIAVALTGIEVMHFWAALVLLGLGWNFMYIGATMLLTETHTPAERAKVQGVNDTACSSRWP